MICPFCSLLCDADNLKEIQCDRRTASLVQLESFRSIKAQLPRLGKQVDPELIIVAIESAIVKEIKKHFGKDASVVVDIPKDGSKIHATVNGHELGKDEIVRVGAQAAKRVVLQKLWDAEDVSFAERIKEASESLRAAKRILITGRIASVATARAAVAFAAKYNATIDCAESGHQFKNVLAIQRSGLNSVSLAEARDHSDFFIVVGDDSMLATCPRMPAALSSGKPSPQTVLLLGNFSRAATELWKKAGFDTWSVPCDLSMVPIALAQWSRFSVQSPSNRSSETHPTKQLFERMAQDEYTTVVWSAENLKLDQADLWVERMLQWIAGRNETTRCAALPWSSLDGTFQQVCTWLTGFPGRVKFRDGVPQYDPHGQSYEQWIARTPVGISPESFVVIPESVVVLIDETASSTPFLKLESMQASGQSKVIELTGHSMRFPTAVAGVEVMADIFRADQTLLARVSPTRKLVPSVKSAAEWLEGLSQ